MPGGGGRTFHPRDQFANEIKKNTHTHKGINFKHWRQTFQKAHRHKYSSYTGVFDRARLVAWWCVQCANFMRTGNYGNRPDLGHGALLPLLSVDASESFLLPPAGEGLGFAAGSLTQFQQTHPFEPRSFAHYRGAKGTAAHTTQTTTQNPERPTRMCARVTVLVTAIVARGRDREKEIQCASE